MEAQDGAADEQPEQANTSNSSMVTAPTDALSLVLLGGLLVTVTVWMWDIDARALNRGYCAHESPNIGGSGNAHHAAEEDVIEAATD